MKRCPACQRTYDDTQNFCLSDGTTLVSVAGDSPGFALPTENLPYSSTSAPTEVLHGAPTSGYQGATTPMPYMPPQPQRRNPLLWIGVGALVLVAAVVGIILATRGSGGTTAGGGGRSDPTPTPPPGKTSPTPIASGTTYNSPDGRFSITLPAGFSSFTAQNEDSANPRRKH